MKDFEKLWRESYPALRRLARSVAMRREDAEDLLSDTALRALQSFGSFDEGTSFHNWTRRIMANVWLNVLRDRLRAVALVSFEDLSPDYLTRILSGDFDDPFGDLYCESLEELLGSLDQMDARILVAVSQGDDSPRIASGLRCSPSRARARICRARERVGRALLN